MHRLDHPLFADKDGDRAHAFFIVDPESDEAHAVSESELTRVSVR